MAQLATRSCDPHTKVVSISKGHGKKRRKRRNLAKTRTTNTAGVAATRTGSTSPMSMSTPELSSESDDSDYDDDELEQQHVKHLSSATSSLRLEYAMPQRKKKRRRNVNDDSDTDDDDDDDWIPGTSTTTTTRNLRNTETMSVVDDGSVGASSSSCHSPLKKKQRRQPQPQQKSKSTEANDETTRIIPASNKDDDLLLLLKMYRFVKRIEEDSYFDQLQNDYEQAEINQQLEEYGWYQGIRRINGNRYEIKLLGEYVRTVWCQQWESYFHSFPQELVEYAERQAMSDDRVKTLARPNNHHEHYEDDDSIDKPPSCHHPKPHFTDWSFIVSDGYCEAQPIHIDTVKPNLQFGLVCMSGTPGTKVVRKESFCPQTVEELFDRSTNGPWKDAPLILKDCLMSYSSSSTDDEEDDHWVQMKKMNTLLRNYGGLLHTKKSLQQPGVIVGAETLAQHNNSDDGDGCCFLQVGDMICTNGGIPHYGPACNTFRMVLFGSAAPTQEQLYNVDTQVVPHTSVLLMIRKVWDQLSLQQPKRYTQSSVVNAKSWLLRRLAACVQEYPASLIENNNDMAGDLLYDFMRKIAATSAKLEMQQKVKSFESIPDIVDEFVTIYGHMSTKDLFSFETVK